MLTIVTLTTLAVTVLFAALAVITLLPDAEPQPDEETHDDEPERDPWAPVSPVTPETFGRGSLPARIETVHNGHTVRLEPRPDYGAEEQLALISRIYELQNIVTHQHRPLTAGEEIQRTILEEMYVRNVQRGMPDPHNDGIH